MAKFKGPKLFNAIAPVYGLFYQLQKRRFTQVIQDARDRMDLRKYHTILDVGCGTGALCAVLDSMGLSVTGVEPAEKMLTIARRQGKNSGIRFLEADVLAGLPFADAAFDLSIASYVAHGMSMDQRRRMYRELARVSKSEVIIYDYNRKRGLLTTVVEWLEQGDYFRFIREAEGEMRDCVSEMKECFSGVRVIDVDTRASWYICTPAPGRTASP